MVEPKIMEATQPAPITPIFEFKQEDRIQEISLALLKMSIRREAGLVSLRTIPVQYWTLYDLIESMLEQSNINYSNSKIYVQNNSSRAFLTDTEKSAGYDHKRAPINRWRFDKIIAIIHLPLIAVTDGDAGDIRNAAIGITLNKEGLVVSFGMNLNICQNFNVMGGGTTLRTYPFGGVEGIQWELFHHKLGKMISKLDQVWAVQNEAMRMMKEYSFPPDLPIIDEIVGDLYIKAIQQAYFKGSYTPFDTHELSNFVKAMIEDRKDNTDVSSVWDLYNWGTSIMKPGTVDIGEIANSSSMWSQYLMNRFDIDVPEIDTEDDKL